MNSTSTVQKRIEAILADESQQLVLFDGVCNLCNSSVDFLIRRNKKHNLFFLALQSEEAKALSSSYGIPLEHLSSIVVVHGKKFKVKSGAVLNLSLQLDGAWPILARIALLVPAFIRDAVYSQVARSRYRWFGKKESCRLPTPAEATHLLG